MFVHRRAARRVCTQREGHSLNTLEIVALLLILSAGFAYANHYLLGLPRNSGLLVIALATSLVLRLADAVFPDAGIGTALREALRQFNFKSLLLDGFLGFLLFAGALDVDLHGLLSRKWTILALSTVGVVLSALAMAVGVFGVFRLVGIAMPIGCCIVFGALISPTDPVTVLNVLRQLGIPRSLQAIIGGESMFNDGVGIVLYALFLQVALAYGHAPLTVSAVLLNFLREAGGGALLGLVAGGLAFLAMRGIDEYNIELMISLALVSGTYGLAQTLGVSGPVAVVIAGLLMGSIGVRYAVSGYDARLSQQILVADRGASERAPLPADRAGIRRHRSEGINSCRGSDRDSAVACGPRHQHHGCQSASEPARPPQALRDWAADLERSARRHLGRAGAEPAGKPISQPSGDGLLCRRDFHDDRAGVDPGMGCRLALSTRGAECRETLISSAVVAAHVSPAVSWGRAQLGPLRPKPERPGERSRHPAPSPQLGREQLPVPEVRPARRAMRHSRLCRT